MEKTEMMKEFQAKTGIKAMVMVKNGTLVLPSLTIRTSQQFFPSEEYIDWLEAKASSYDRIMSGGKLTMQELANILGKTVAISASGQLEWFADKPLLNLEMGTWDGGWMHLGFLPSDIVDYKGHWTLSRTIPDNREDPDGSIQS